MATYALVCIALAYGLGIWTHWRHALARALHEVQASCRHSWGETFEVAPSAYGHGQHFYKQICRRCGAQRDVNADGTPYEPKH